MLTRVQLKGYLDAMVYDKAVGPLGYPGITHYSANKARLIGFTISLAVEVAPAVRVNAICPGAIMNLGNLW
ncbi:SDR family NAD(P)-dependent oxidoreductase [Arthrobacter sp. NPDC080031]|uniref:SDR family NAD(P)-dependent oxidoreductase n=1 Tax=Arthrobacter sp. NPDC080031 TaxID=3155918 RepID=UPI00344F4714